jgi:hypothetical protein
MGVRTLQEASAPQRPERFLPGQGIPKLADDGLFGSKPDRRKSVKALELGNGGVWRVPVRRLAGSGPFNNDLSYRRLISRVYAHTRDAIDNFANPTRASAQVGCDHMRRLHSAERALPTDEQIAVHNRNGAESILRAI